MNASAANDQLIRDFLREAYLDTRHEWEVPAHEPKRYTYRGHIHDRVHRLATSLGLTGYTKPTKVPTPMTPSWANGTPRLDGLINETFAHVATERAGRWTGVQLCCASVDKEEGLLIEAFIFKRKLALFRAQLD